MAKNAEAFAAGQHPGYEATAWEGLQMSMDAINSKRIKVAINGGALNPRGLAEKVAALIRDKGYDLSVAYVTGDDLLPAVVGLHNMPTTTPSDPWPLQHLDSIIHDDSNGKHDKVAHILPPSFLGTTDQPPAHIVSANAYLGARGIVTAFQRGADIVIAGRVSDASPVIAAAWYWWSWSATDYDALAGSLVAGHLIECSAYVTGGNFAGFAEEEYGLETFLEPGFPIAEVSGDGSCVVTKHEGTGGVVNEDTVRCQLLYELQGNVYLHSDSKAVLDGVKVEEVARDR